MDLPKRKQIRLPEYDYSGPGAYFVTICTADRRCILSEIAVGAATSRPPDESSCVNLTSYGEIVDRAVQNIPFAYPHISVENYVIMPNHVHLLLSVNADENGRMISAPTINTVIGQMKRWASKQIGTSIWQKSFHEHIIRNEKDYREIWAYIESNPAKWAEDRYYSE